MKKDSRKFSHECEFNSASLSYGKANVKIEVQEYNPQLEPRVEWRVGGHPFYSTDCVKCFADLKFSVARTAIYESGESTNALKLASPEHLAPVFLMWPSRRFVVDVSCNEKSDNGFAAEIPLMDGSALPFFLALRRNVGVPEELAFYDAPVHAEWDLFRTDRNDSKPYGSVKITPSETFEVEYVLERNDGVCNFTSAASVSIYSAEHLYNVFAARTFILKNEFDEARKAGLLGGVDESCGLLLDDSAAANASFRVADEPARHKILDLLGDLCFAKPALPKVRLEIINGGHLSHRTILEKVLPYALQ
ncbi:UDP-3-O-acyl-N-acetylglucosamine deacetylase [Fibrobacter sp. UWB12]|uniref:UDP-3-O-acyl-N-acetylglucosamine deacetylase n=1 Tax=Fibrobacter sp. UWB12 TaxID=1896203 RepID=UPI000922FA30|nr:UDP-3-O-acyl-N-acetylglucosamine deacetylase [Fibrobacter sp. UWB12]SHK93310.1 UDP-3-O-acyl N-acetylglycosamine deacetylase [Fibrobacter sp. UWB12]